MGHAINTSQNQSNCNDGTSTDIEDLSPEFRTEEMEVVDKVNKENREEEMDHGCRSSEESVIMDAEELEEGEVAGEDGEDELEEGEIINSDTDPGGEVTEVEDGG